MEEFNKIVVEIFKISANEIKDSLTAKDIPGWDSMNYLLFIAELEKQFNISFSMDEVLNAGSLGDIRNIIRSKGVNI